MQDNDGWSSAIFASDNGHVDVLRTLIDARAEVVVPHAAPCMHLPFTSLAPSTYSTLSHAVPRS